MNSNYERNSCCAQLAAVYSQQGRPFPQITFDNCFNIMCVLALEVFMGIILHVTFFNFFFTFMVNSS